MRYLSLLDPVIFDLHTMVDMLGIQSCSHHRIYEGLLEYNRDDIHIDSQQVVHWHSFVTLLNV